MVIEFKAEKAQYKRAKEGLQAVINPDAASPATAKPNKELLEVDLSNALKTSCPIIFLHKSDQFFNLFTCSQLARGSYDHSTAH